MIREITFNFQLSTNMTEIKVIDIGDFSITFYGGPEGFLNECRVIIALYDKSGKTVGFMKFYNEGTEIKADGFDENNLFNINFPSGQYLNITDTLRSRRPLQLWFDGKVGMLMENKFPPSPPKGINMN